MEKGNVCIIYVPFHTEHPPAFGTLIHLWAPWGAHHDAS